MELKGIFDAHSHYDDPAFRGESEALIGSLFERGVVGIVHASTDPDSANFGIKISQKFPNFYTSVGIHPEYADRFNEKDVSDLEALAKSSQKVVAVGEIGLDYHYEGYDKPSQIALFRAQIELANSLGLPVIIHCRDAIGDCMEILRELRPKGVMHCFSGSWETAKEFLSLGMYLSFTGVLTFKSAKKAVEVVRNMPLDRLLLETDCPYMAPEPHRGERCDSSMIFYTASKAAEIRGIPLPDLLSVTASNSRRLFSLGD